MSSDQKMAHLDDLFMQAENAKVEFGQVCGSVNAQFQEIITMLKAEKGTELPSLLAKLKSFLDSGINTMNSIQADLKNIVADCNSIQSSFRQMGAN